MSKDRGNNQLYALDSVAQCLILLLLYEDIYENLFLLFPSSYPLLIRYNLLLSCNSIPLKPPPNRRIKEKVVYILTDCFVEDFCL